jgi:hypothetical protein
MTNPFTGLMGTARDRLGQAGATAGGAIGGALGDFGGTVRDFLRGPVGRRRAEQERFQQDINPIREQLLQMLQGQQPFAGGPMSEFAGAPPGVQPGAAPGAPPAPAAAPPPAVTTPLDPERERQQLPRDLRPPPQTDQVLRDTARRHGVPLNALRALAAQESNFRPDVVGGTPIDLPGQEGDRARGMFQFTPQEIARVRRDVRPDFDPNNPEHAADETARRLRMALDRGADITQAMTEHFGGPDPALHGPRTRRYQAEISEKFRRLEEVSPSLEGGEMLADPSLAPPGATAMPPGAPGSETLAPGAQVGPFGTELTPSPAAQSPHHALLAAAASDPAAFAQMFASPGGMESLMGMMGGGPAEAMQQTRVVSGDSAQGRAMGLQAGERARVKGQVSPSGEFLPMEVVASPFDAPDKGGPLINMYNMNNDEIETLRRDDPKVDQLAEQGWIIAADGQMLDQMRGMSVGERRELAAMQSNARKMVETGADILELLQADPDMGTFLARGAAVINDLRADVSAAARALGRDFDDSVLDVTVHDETFRRLGISNRRLQSLITSLAFQRAGAEAGVGRITNRMVQQFIEEIGGNARDPVTLATLVHDTVTRGARGFMIDFETRTGQEFTGELGMERLPALEDLQFRRQFPEGEPGAPDDPAARTPAREPAPRPEGLPAEAVELPGFRTQDGRRVWETPDGTRWVED